MRLAIALPMVAIVLVLSSCSDTRHYPLSGETCGPSDPVKDMSGADCNIPLG